MIDFKLLTGPELAAIDPDGIPWPFDTFAWCAFEDGKLVGRSAIMNLPVVEGTWVEPTKRNGTLAARLLWKIEDLYRSLGKTHAMAMVREDQPEIQYYMERFGYKREPLVFYSKELKQKEEAA